MAYVVSIQKNSLSETAPPSDPTSETLDCKQMDRETKLTFEYLCTSRYKIFLLLFIILSLNMHVLEILIERDIFTLHHAVIKPNEKKEVWFRLYPEKNKAGRYDSFFVLFLNSFLGIFRPAWKCIK